MLLLVHGHHPGLAASDGWVGCESEPGHTHLIRGFNVYVPWFHPQLYELQSEDTVLAVSYIGLYGHHLREAKELTWQILLTLIPLYDLILCVFTLDDLTARRMRAKKCQDSVYNPNPLHRGIWEGEALALRLQK